MQLGLGLGVQYSAGGHTISDKSFYFSVAVTTTFTLPLEATGTYNFRCYWGDGTSSAITAYNQAEITHTYPSAGTYNIEIYGTCYGWKFVTAGEKTKITEIKQWGTLRLGNANSYFSGCSNLTITATDILDLTGTTTFQGMFTGCSKLTSIPSLTSWNTANITTMNSMFDQCALFNQSLVGLNTANVTNMAQLLRGCTVFNGSVTNLNTSKVTTLVSTFNGCTAFNQPLTGWDCTKVTTYQSMLTGCTNFNQDLSEVIKLDAVPNGGHLELYATGSYLLTNNFSLLLIALYDYVVGHSNTPTGVLLSVGTTKYTSESASARAYLADTVGWTIVSGVEQ